LSIERSNFLLPGEFMADNSSTFTLRVKTEGMQEAKQDSQAIRNNLEGAQKAASGTASSKRMASSAAAQPTGKAGASAGVFTGQEVENYNRARGAAGAAGGTARDFADQARGLGGLVRLYATVAANAFAAAAAFGALSRAMDTSNMVKGLDQLGAASGVALGNLSKRLFLATDGAVSLREAMEATAKATGAGLSTDQILKLGEVAKKASQTLGVNMTDALSRLSRGITKLEPELLDELGIFVKIDDAASKYALSVGKSTSALTDFERRQAFANAVLDQGNKKFGEINIDINPYTKLAATFQNLTQTILEFINKGLAPVAQIFADNSVLLGAAFAFIATKVLKMAIPALGEWQSQLVKTAQTAKEKAQAINTAFGEAWVDRWETRLKLPELRAGVKVATDELKKVALPADASKNVQAGYQTLLRGEELSKTQLTATTRAMSIKKKELEALGDAQDKQSKKQKLALEREISSLERIIALNKQRQALSLAEGKIETAAGAQPGILSGEAARNRIAKGASTTAIALAELAAIPSQTMEKGFMDAMKNMKANLEKQGVGFVKRWSTLAVGALASATAAIGTFVASITMWIGVFMAVGFAIYGALKYFSATKKESELTAEAITRLEDASKSAALTLEKLSMSKDPLESLSVQTIQARANALKELGDSAALAVKRAFDEISKMNAGDKLLNFVSKLWSGDVQTKLSEGLADSIKNSFRLAEDTKLTQEAKKSIEAILGTSVQSANLEQVIKKVAASGDDGKLKEIVKIIENMGNAAAVSAAKGTELKESFAKVTTGIQEFNKSILPTDSLSKIAQDSAVAAQKLGVALADPVQALTAMKDISGNIDMLSIFPADVAKTLMSYNTELTNIVQRTADAKKATEAYDKQIIELSKDIKTLGQNYQPGSETEARVNEIKRQIEELEGKKVQLRVEIQTDTGAIRGVFDQAVRASLITSADMMAARLAAEISKAQTVVKGALAGLLGDTVGGIRQRAEIEKEGIRASMEVTRQSFNLANKMEELKIEMERKRLQDEKLFLETKKVQFGISEEEETKLKNIGSRLLNLDRQENIVKGRGSQSSQQLARQGADADVIALQQRFEGFRTSLAGAAASTKAIDIKAEYEVRRKVFELNQKDFQLQVDAANKQKDIASIVSGIYGIENQSALNAKIQAENTAQQLTDEKTRRALVEATDEKADLYVRALNEASKAKGKLTKQQEKELENFKLALIESGREVDRFDEGLKLRTELKKVNDDIQKQQSKSAGLEKEAEFQQTSLKNAEELAKISIDSKKQEFDALVAAGRLSEEYAANRLADIAAETQALAVQSQLREAAAVRDAALRAALSKAAQAEIAGEDQESITAIRVAEETRAIEAYNAKKVAIDAANRSATRAIEITKQQSLETAKQNEELKKQAEILGLFEGIADTLGQAFGKAGEVLGKFVGTISQIIDNQETYNKKRAEQSRIIDEVAEKEKSGYLSADDVAKMNQATKTRNDLDKKNAKDELTNNAKILGSAKTLFKEKTAAYKILSGMEKAMHIARLVMDAKELASNFAKTGVSLVESGKRMFAYGQEAITSALRLPPPAGFIAGAAMAAIVASIIGKTIGGSVSAPAPGSSSADRQETQGTGMAWREGQKVETGGGVFGDSEAKSNSIRDSLEMIKDNSVDGLSYNNEMVNLLTSIDKNIGKAAVGLFGVKGLRANTAFGTVEGTKSGGGLFGTGLFASKTTSQITDSGILVKGTFRQLAGEIDGAVVQLYEDVTKTKKTWYGRTKSWTERSTTEMPQALQYINDIFSQSTELFINLGSKLDMGSEQIYAALDNMGSIDFEGSLRGLKGEDFENELQALISTQLGNASRAIFGTLVDEFKQFGEDALQTVIRVLDQTEKVNQVLKNLNVAAPTDRLQNIRFADTLVELSGGIEEFVSQNKFFTENFLTDAERLAPIQKAVTEELGRLNLSFVDTREEFKAQVIAALALGDAGAELYTALMRLAPGFAEVTKEAKAATAELSAEDLVAKINQTRVKALQIQAQISGREADALAVVTLQRELELAELDKYPEVQRNILKNNQNYIYALEDELAAKEKLVKRRDLLKNTINTLTKSIETLAAYKNTLLLGDTSVLLPVDKYQQAKTQFEDLLTTINKTPGTEAEKSAQLEAVNKLPQVADSFLQASRIINASSGQYTSDFKSVTDALDQTSGVLTGQKTDAELQLEAIKEQAIILDNIAESSATTADLIEKYLNAVNVRNETGSTLGPPSPTGTNTTPLDTSVANALTALATEFKNFKESMMGAEGFPSIKTALTGTGGVKDALTGTGGVKDALTGTGGVKDALTGTGGVKDALTGTNGVVAAVTDVSKEIKITRNADVAQTSALVDTIATSSQSVATAVVDTANNTTSYQDYSTRTQVIIGRYGLDKYVINQP
jgi:hypothetical protein